MLKTKNNSLGLRLSMLIIVSAIPVLVIFLITNIYAIHNETVQREQMLFANVDLFKTQIDNTLVSIQRYPSEMVNDQADLFVLSKQERTDDRLLAQIRIQNRFADILEVNNDLGGMFAYSLKSGCLAYKYVSNANYRERTALNSYIRNISETNGKWTPVFIDDLWYLFYVIRIGNTLTGSIVRVPDILNQYIDSSREIFETVSFITESGIINNEYTTGDNQYLNADQEEIVSKCASGEYSVIVYPVANHSRWTFTYFQIVVFLLAAVYAVVLILQRQLYKNKIVAPLNKTINAMRLVQEGNLNTSIASNPKDYDELLTVQSNFNDMNDP